MSEEAQDTTLTYKLVGPNAGKTLSLSKGKYKFRNGLFTIEAREDHVAKGMYQGLTRVLARSYNAHPVGSKALERAEADWKALKNGGKDGTGQALDAGQASAGKTAGRNKPAAAGADAEGHAADTGDGDGAGGEQGSGGDAAPSQLVGVLRGLDPKSGKHWTATGLPNLKVVAEAMGREVSRDEIEEAIPGFTRDAARGREAA